MYQVIIVIHVLLGLGVIGLVLMQQGKGADAGAAFGTGTSGSVFGAQGAASFLSRTTAILAALFFTTSLGLAILNSHKGAIYDLMSTPSADSGALSIPAGNSDKATDAIPSVPTSESLVDSKLEEPKASDKASGIEDTVVPQPEAIKTVDDKSKKSEPK
ncbi:MAG: preprotein translocase subunit SecG [Methylococcaceae bacterium]|nr:preprotein translocase subunit SecG [Methylococcaceae bacterium]